MPVLALRLFAPFSGGTGPPGPGAAAQAGGSRRALGGSRVLSVRRLAVTDTVMDTVMDTVTGFSLQRARNYGRGPAVPTGSPKESH